jgi:atypical dual specificity phosphatase
MRESCVRTLLRTWRMSSKSGDWIVPGRLYACAYPVSEAELAALAAAGIRHIINLTSRRHDAASLAAVGIDETHLPVRDFSAPSPRVLDTAIAAIAESHTAGDAIAVHCRGGLGRTGTVIAAWLTTQGVSPAQAIDQIRAVRPGSIETRRQERAVHEFAMRRETAEP